MTDRSRHSGQSQGSEKILYYQSQLYPTVQPLPQRQELALKPQYYYTSSQKSTPGTVSAYSHGGYSVPATYSTAKAVPAGYTGYSTSRSRSARKYQLDDGRTSADRSRLCMIILVAVIIAIVVAAAIALGIVFGVVNKEDDKKDATTPRPDAVAVSYEASLTLDQTYSTDYADPSTAAYIDLKNKIEPEVNSLMQDSELGPSFIDAKVTGFRSGSLLALIKFNFRRTSVTIVATNEVKQLTISLVRNVLKTDLPKRAAFVQEQKILPEQTAVIVLTGTGNKDLGDECNENGDGAKECEDSFTVCQGSKCRCMDDYYDSNNDNNRGGTCERKIEYEEYGCFEGRHCETANAICLNTQCKCDPNTHFHDDGVCKANIGINAVGCKIDSHCSTPGAVCTCDDAFPPGSCTYGTCRCPDTHTYQNGQCVTLPCPAGQFVTDNRLCQNCPIGTYRTGLAGENCQQCPDGLHTLESGAMDESQCSVTPCSKGQFYIRNAQQCQPCVRGTYQDQPGKFQCITCPNAVPYTPATGADSLALCTKMECITWYHENSIIDNCYQSYSKLLDEKISLAEKCSHYEYFMGCVKYNSLVYDVDCTITQINSIYGNQYSICPGNSLASLDSMMPATKEGLCQNIPTARYLLQYGCITYDISVYQTDEDKCKALITLQGCMLRTLESDAGCQLSDVRALTQKDEVRAGLLTAIPSDCDSRFEMTPCFQHYFMGSSTHFAHCFTAPTQFQFATIVGQVDTINNYNNQKKLKCSIYETSIQCLLGTSPYSYTTAAGQTMQCRPSDVAPVVKDGSRMYYEVMRASGIIPDIAINLFKKIDYSECDAALATTISPAVCPSSGVTADWAMGSCLAQVYEVTRGLSPGPACNAIGSFKQCLQLVRLPHGDSCPDNHVWNSLGQHTDFTKRVADGFDPPTCLTTECVTWYHEKSILSNCYGAYSKLVDPKIDQEEKCSHYEYFMGCVKYSSLVHDVHCTFTQIDSIFGNQYSICPGNTFASLDSMMPATKEGLCQNIPTARYMLQYSCITYNINVLSTDEDKCKALIALQGCMLASLESDAGCQFSDVRALTQKDEVRAGLLEAIPKDCDSRFQMTPCFHHYFLRSSIATDLAHCFTAPTQFHFATIVGQVDTMYNYNNQKKLKCSIYETSIQCLLSTSPYSYTTAAGQTMQCRPSDVAPVVKDGSRMYYEVMRAIGIIPDIAIHLFKKIDYSECDAALATTVSPAVCPSSGVAADWAMGSCVAQVFEVTRGLNPRGACNAIGTFKQCLQLVRLPHGDSCPDDHLWESLEQHTDYTKRIADEFDPPTCLANECVTWYHEKSIVSSCYGAYSKLVDPNINQAEKCSHYEYFMGCVKYNSLVHGVHCTFTQIDSIFGNQYSICTGNTIATLDSMMPDTKEGLCQNVPTARYMLQYGCITYDISALSTDEDKCKALITLQGCMLESLESDAGCQLSDVRALTQKDEVRAGLLEAIPKDCDSRFETTPCFHHYFLYASSTSDLAHCFTAPAQFQFATIVGQVDTMYNYNSQKKLKCSIYEASIQCLLSTSPYTYTTAGGQSTLCRPVDVAPVVKDGSRMYYDIMRASGIIPAIAINMFKKIDYTECDVALATTVSAAVCPTSGVTADWAMGSCVAQVFEVTRGLNPRGACNAIDSFKQCLQGVRLPHADKCDDDHVWDSLEQHTDFTKRVADGFNPFTCLDSSQLKCTTEFIEKAKHDECSGAYNKLMETQDAEKQCWHFSNFLGCVKFHALINYENCPIQELEAKAKAASGMGSFHICKGCEYWWSLKYPTGRFAGGVMVHLDNTTSDAIISLTAYDFDENSQWVGVGISTDTFMPNTDIITAQVNGGQWTVTDRYATTRAYPSPDSSIGGTNDVTIEYGKMNSGHARVAFTRKMETNDNTRDVPLTSQTRLLYARGQLSNNDITKHTFKSVSNSFKFQCSPYEYWEEEFPDTVQQACTNPSVHRYMWEYDCLQFDMGMIPSEDGRCRTEISRRQCVFNTFKPLGCAFDDVIVTSQQPQVRYGLLDDTNPSCESQLPDSTCEIYFLTMAAENAPQCFAPLYNFENLIHFKTLQEINALPSYNAQKTLKCSILDSFLNCFEAKVPGLATAGDDNSACTPYDIAPAASNSAHIYYSMVLLPMEKPEVSYKDCEASALQQMPAKVCPPPGEMADLLIGLCSAQVLTAIVYGGGDPCKGKQAFEDCSREFRYSIPNGELCPDDYVQNMIQTQSYHLKENLGGLDPTGCKDPSDECPAVDGAGICVEECSKDDDCSEGEICCFNGCGHTCHRVYTPVPKCSTNFIERAKHEECNGAYRKLMDPEEPAENKCWHFSSFLGCIKFHALINAEDCPIRDLEAKAKAASGMGSFSICKACDHWWSVKYSNGSYAGGVKVHIDTVTSDATVSLTAFDFNDDTEWVALGVSYDASMANSDIYSAQKSGGNWIVTDRFASYQGYPSPDSDSDANIISGRMLNGNAMVKFSRKIDTGDTGEDITINFDRLLLFARGPLSINNDLLKHTFKTASGYFNFQCSPYDFWEREFPDTVQQLCTNPRAHRYIWEYECLPILPFDIGVISEEDNRCRTEISRRKCVFDTFEPLGCAFSDVVETSQLPQVRYGLLDHTKPGCESRLPDSVCEIHFLTEAGEVGGKCFSPIYNFVNLVFFKSVGEINALRSAGGQKSLKCSLFDIFHKCFAAEVPSLQTVGVGNTPCTPADVAAAASNAVHIYYGIALLPRGQPEVSFKDCEGSVMTTMPPKACPLPYEIADIVLGHCAEEVLTAIAQGGGDPCQGKQEFIGCTREIHIPNKDLCDADFFDNAMVTYADFLAQNLAGYNPAVNSC